MRRMNVRADQTGFTVVELMVATLVFSVILVTITVGVISFTHSYYKGIVSSKTQSAAQSVMDDLTEAIQYSDAAPVPSADGKAYCIDNVQFAFARGQEQFSSPNGTDQTAHGLYRKTLSVAGCPDPVFDPADSVDYLSERMRVVNLDITPIEVGEDTARSGSYRVTVRIVYGDDDLLNDPASLNAQCVSRTGSQFCAAASLSTTVQKRSTAGV